MIVATAVVSSALLLLHGFLDVNFLFSIDAAAFFTVIVLLIAALSVLIALLSPGLTAAFFFGFLFRAGRLVYGRQVDFAYNIYLERRLGSFSEREYFGLCGFCL